MLVCRGEIKKEIVWLLVSERNDSEFEGVKWGAQAGYKNSANSASVLSGIYHDM